MCVRLLALRISFNRTGSPEALDQSIYVLRLHKGKLTLKMLLIPAKVKLLWEK